MSNQGLGLKKRLNLLCKKPNKASDVVTKKNILQHAGAALCHSAWFPTNMENWLHMTITELSWKFRTKQVTKKNILQHAGAALCHSAWFPTNMEIWLHMTITESFHEHAMPQVETLKGGDGGGWDACWLFNQENWCWALEVNNYKYSKIEYFRFGGVVERKIECMFKKFSYITNDAQNMDGGSTITYQSRFKICSTAIQIQLKIWTQPRRSLPNSSTAQLKVQLCNRGPMAIRQIWILVLNSGHGPTLRLSEYVICRHHPGPRAMVGEVCSRKGTFRSDRGLIFLSGLRLALLKISKICPDFWPGRIFFLPKFADFWPKIAADEGKRCIKQC